MPDTPLYLPRRSEIGPTTREVLQWIGEPEVVDHATQAKITRDVRADAAERRRQALLVIRGELEAERAHHVAQLRGLDRQISRVERRLKRAGAD